MFNPLKLLHQKIMNYWEHTHTFLKNIFNNMEAKDAIMRDREAQEAIQKKELQEVTTLL